jgi:hypothetical protein
VGARRLRRRRDPGHVGAAIGSSKSDKKNTVSAGASPTSSAASTTVSVTAAAAPTVAAPTTATPTSQPKTAASTTAPPTTIPSKAVYQVGETAKTADLEVTLNGATDPYTPANQVFTPQPGNRWVAVDVTVKNNGDHKVTFSTLALTELKDSQSQAWTVSLTGSAADPTKPQLDGDVVPGDSRRGIAVFEVPEAATGLTLRVKGEITASGAVWQIP